MSIEVEIPQTTISNKAIEVEYSNSNTAIAEGTKELEVTVNRREYNIVGDELYIPKRYEDAPQWLRDIIDTVTSTAISSAISDVSTLGDMLDGLIAELEVAKNTYTISVISDNDINERINTAIETLNSSLADADSTILDVAMTRVTPEEAQTIALGILSASISGGDISAAVQNLQSAIADVDSARALDYTRLNASIGDEFESTATAISTINAYVGIDEAGASTGTGLSAYLEDSNGVIGGADSQLNNTIKVTAEGIESKFAYNSVVNINGIYKKSGFGLTTNYTSGSGTEANPYVSEFWIDASRLKFTNSNQTGQTAPFTIDASGITPQITFNGKVAFTNVTGTSSLALTDMSNVTTIDGGKIITNAAFVNNLNATGGIVADTIRANKVITSPTINGGEVNSTTLNSTTINSAIINSPIINGLNLSISDIKVKSEGDPSKFGKITQSLTSGYIYGLSYGAGFIANRVCSNSSIIKVTGFLNISIGTDGNYGTSWSLSGRLYDSYGTLDNKTISASANGTQLSISTTIIFTAIIYGSRIPTTGTNTFGIQVTSASNAVYNIMSTNWVATIYNQ